MPFGGGSSEGVKCVSYRLVPARPLPLYSLYTIAYPSHSYGLQVDNRVNDMGEELECPGSLPERRDEWESGKLIAGACDARTSQLQLTPLACLSDLTLRRKFNTCIF